MKKFDVAAYRKQVQENFSGMDGESWGNMGGDPAMNYDGNPAMNANGVEEEAPQINFTVVNSNTTLTQTAVFFGSNINLSPSVSNYGSQAGITITPDYGVAYSTVLRDIGSAPFTVGRIRVQCSANAAQVTQGITVTSTNIYGDSKTSPISMLTNISEYQQQLTIASSTKAFDVTGNVYFSLPVLPGTTLTLSVFIKSKVNVARQLNGAASIGSYIAPNTGIKPLMVASNGALKQLGH